MDNNDEKNKRVSRLYEKFSADDANQLKDDLKDLLEQPAFRRILAYILKRMRVFGSIGGDKPDEIMRSIGWREAGLDLYYACNRANSKMVIKAIEERNQVEEQRRALVYQAATEEQ